VWGRKGPNDEFRMTKSSNPNDETDGATDRILISSFELHSSFVICHRHSVSHELPRSSRFRLAALSR